MLKSAVLLLVSPCCHIPQVTLPVYLNSTRAELLFTLDFKAEGVQTSTDHRFYERGVALLSSAL